MRNTILSPMKGKDAKQLSFKAGSLRITSGCLFQFGLSAWDGRVDLASWGQSHEGAQEARPSLGSFFLFYPPIPQPNLLQGPIYTMV